MQQITRTASGKWTTRVYLGRDAHGKKITRRITGADRSAVRMEAAAIEAGVQGADTAGCTIEQAYNAMMADRGAVLSPSTVRGYNSYAHMLESEYAPFWHKRVSRIKRSDVQAVVNALTAAGRSPKTVHNYYLLINSVLKYKGHKVDGVILPERQKPNLNIPSEAVVRATIDAVRNTDLYIPVLLAVFGPMRRGEICALITDDVKGDVIHVQRDMVDNPEGEWITKPPKTYCSDRLLKMPPEVIAALSAVETGEGDKRYVPCTPNQLTDKFRRALKRAGIPHYRFHDLRHFCASYLHARGVPDIYIQQRTGHASPQVLRQVYTHTMADQSEEITGEMLGWFSEIIN